MEMKLNEYLLNIYEGQNNLKIEKIENSKIVLAKRYIILPVDIVDLESLDIRKLAE